MQITFYGVRGSLPSPGPKTLKYGGNTTCVFVEFASGDSLIIDAGSGLRVLGDQLAATHDDIHLLLTHNHWDHVMGFPFFKPAYQTGRRIHIYCNWPEDDSVPSLLGQMRAPFFPVSHEVLRSVLISERTLAGDTFSPLPGVSVITQALNHPDGGYAFRIEADGKSFVFATDNELQPPGTPLTPYADWVGFAANCDLLVHDATYRDDEMASKGGWGHSSFEQAVRLACDSGARQLALFHHDTDRSDDALDAIGEEARRIAAGACPVMVARELQTIPL